MKGTRETVPAYQASVRACVIAPIGVNPEMIRIVSGISGPGVHIPAVNIVAMNTINPSP